MSCDETRSRWTPKEETINYHKLYGGNSRTATGKGWQPVPEMPVSGNIAFRDPTLTEDPSVVARKMDNLLIEHIFKSVRVCEINIERMEKEGRLNTFLSVIRTMALCAIAAILAGSF